MVTEHANQNAIKYLNPQHTNRTDAAKFQAAVNRAMGKRSSTAVVLTITAVDNAHRDNWAMNDRLVGIVRHGDLVTVMLSRKNQINSAHLRTDRVVIV